MSLARYYYPDEDTIEIGIDEVGRGPMFGSVYCSAVILPKNNTFEHKLMKDSKKFHSKKKIEAASEYIKKHALNYSIAFEDENCIDNINIKNATHNAMHKAIKDLLNNIGFFEKSNNKFLNKKFIILVDGRDFKPFTYLDSIEEIIKEIPCICIEGGDNKYTSIAAASILAKVERDNYISELCRQYPKLDEYYDLLKNKGYGTAKHMEGLKKYGISKWHRKSYGICKELNINNSIIDY